jgi:hypothetical protein
MAIPVFLAGLLSQGLNLLGNAALIKGKDWIREKTGVDLDKGQLSSEDYTRLKEFELAHELELMKLQQEDNKLSVELERAYLEDTQSARSMQVSALAQEDLFSKRFIYYYAVFWSVATTLYVAAITFGRIPDSNVRFADTILGFILGTVVAQIISFFYGSSRSSQRKDAVIEEAIHNVSRK